MMGKWRPCTGRRTCASVAGRSTPTTYWRSLSGRHRPAALSAVESQMDDIARELGVDPAEYRLRHAVGG
ncbi:molybdopterin-dependent oxidoreductase [Pseudonocardia sp. MCCB 268]|nr:molybdopterin-dependent oxidoreductase [Pseudonocardia cytotoxica]